MIFTSFLSALSQMGDPRFRGVLLRGIGLTVALLFGVTALTVWGAGFFIGDAVTLPWIGTVTWIDTVISWALLPLMVLLSVFLMIPVASAITSLFLDEVAQAVEDRHYPALGPASAVPIPDAIRDTLTFLGILIAANIAAWALYLAVPPFAPLIFWGLNGFLLGREYFTLAAIRRVGRIEAARLRRKHLPTIWAAGILMALPLTIPLVNVLIPVLGAATFTHIFHRLTRS